MKWALGGTLPCYSRREWRRLSLGYFKDRKKLTGKVRKVDARRPDVQRLEDCTALLWSVKVMSNNLVVDRERGGLIPWIIV